MPLATGKVLNKRYRIVKLLGQGGFGAVYRAWDLNLKRPFALKENFDLTPESVRQFQREATFLAELHHPNLPRVIDCFLIPGQGQYLVMDFIEGETLDEKMEQVGGPLSEAQVFPWIDQICDALTFLHSQNPPIIHRDIKPANVKITPEDKAVLVDFGIAKSYSDQMQTTLGARAVTEGYSPPEQYGRGITDKRSDVYSLGAMLYHVLTGEIPIESIRRQLGSKLVPPRSLNPNISSRTEDAILKAVQIEPADRFQNAAEFKAALASPVAVLPPAGMDTNAFEAELDGAYDDTLIAPPLQGPTPEPKPKQVEKSKAGRFFGLGIMVVGFLCVLLVGLGAMGGILGFIKRTSTPTPSPIPIIFTESVLETSTPTQMRAEEPTQEPTLVPPTSTKTATVTPTMPPPTPTETLTEEKLGWYPCDDVYASRLQIDDQAYVSYYPPLKNNVRSQPRLSASLLGRLDPGEKMKILEGPACADGMVWWKVRSLETGLKGWTSEGDRENYWLVPMP